MPTQNFNYVLANISGYKFDIVKIGHSNYDKLAYYNKENFPDVEITRPGTDTDLSLLHNKSLMTVNGYVYPTEYISNRLYIPKATLSMLQSRNNNIGIISFNKLTTPLQKIQLTESMISTQSPFSLFEKAIITFPVNIIHPILIISGYMIFENSEYFYRISDTSFVLRMDKLNYIEKLYETQRYRNIFNELNIPVSVNNPSMIEAATARSNETITKFLTTFNSFLVNINTLTLTNSKIYLEHSNVPGNFRTEKEPTLPIIVGYGKLAEYHKTKTTDNKYTVYINDAYYNNHIFSNSSYNDITMYNDHRVIGSSYQLCQAFFLNITSTT